jgi:LysM repeat protein
MTREMKVSLLVGLAFVIVIGILFSDHVAVDREKPTARIERVVANGSRATQVPGAMAALTGAENPVTAPDQVNPQGPVVRKEDLAAGTGVALSGVTAPTSPELDITPAAPTQPIEISISPAVPVRGGADAQPVTGGNLAGTSGTKIVDNVTTEPLGPSIINLSQVKGATVKSVTGTASMPATAAAATKTYAAQSGDSLYKMVAKVYGKYTYAAEKAVIKANPELAANPKAIKIGKVYQFPDLSGAAGTVAAAGATSSGAREVMPQTETSAGGTVVAGTGVDAPAGKAEKAEKTFKKTTLYTVKDGDSLWKIAKSQLGSATPAAIETINKLNSEALGGKGLRPGMQLKLPTREAYAAAE